MELGDTRTASATWLLHWVLPWQFVHLLGSAAWNVAGVVLVAQGRQPLGPTASLVVAVVLLLLGVGLWIFTTVSVAALLPAVAWLARL